ncbi:PQQ-binding-like beta-propeller repeat protein [Bradyrhizobium sp. HKCCYLS3013]|uniref:outer membrane protein assembly factor BamB family protein n=1 Tax=Bradyrhizobium sp. HKCCYLS3013 TaxID=3420735 RepID=UPI003EB739F6
MRVINVQSMKRADIFSEIDKKSIYRSDARPISTRGRFQSWMIDLRAAFMRPDLLAAIADEFWSLNGDRDQFQIGGMETAAIPLLTAILLRAPERHRGVNGFIIRKERKATGLGRIIEGEVTKAPVVLVDDLINSAKSAEKARAVAEAAGASIQTLFVVIDYESKAGRQWRTRHGIEVQSLFKLHDFGLSLELNPAPPRQRYRQLWHTAVPGGVPFHIVPKSAPLLVGAVLFRGCDAAKMQAFDTETGTVLWEYQVTGAAPGKGIWSSPCYHDGRLYFGAYNGVAYCLDASNGRPAWVRAHGEWIGASPLVVAQHGLVYFGLEYERPWARGGIAALDIQSGEKVWEHPVGKYQHGSPAYWRGGDIIIWGIADHVMAGLEAKSGKLVWAFKTRRSVKYSPAICERRGLVAFASFDKSIYVLEAATGRKLGEWETGEICYTTPLIVGDRMFCGSGDRSIYVIDLATMTLAKKISAGARVYSSPRLVDGRVVIGTNGGVVMEIDPVTLEILGRLQLPDAITNAVAATPDGSRIFVSTYMNHLYAFERLPDDNGTITAGRRVSVTARRRRTQNTQARSLLAAGD